jgi:ribokinase
MTRFDAVGFGALNVDKLFRVNKIAQAEEESFVTDSEISCGGSAANAMVGLARLGCRAGFIGKVASDREGEMLIQDFRKEGVDTSGVTQTAHGRSGTVTGFVDQKGDRALYIDSGVNDTIRMKEIDLKYISQTKFLHLTSFVGETSFRTQKKLLDVLPETVRVSFDPGIPCVRKGLKKLLPIIEKTHVAMPNAIELARLTGRDDYRKGAEFLLKKGARIVAVKLGGKGCYVTDGVESHAVEPFKVKVVDTTGAGDAFCAGFLYGLLNGRSLCECGRIGNFVASRCIMKMGARAGLPRKDDLKLLG